jgi:hypothetical protein
MRRTITIVRREIMCFSYKTKMYGLLVGLLVTVSSLEVTLGKKLTFATAIDPSQLTPPANRLSRDEAVEKLARNVPPILQFSTESIYCVTNQLCCGSRSGSWPLYSDSDPIVRDSIRFRNRIRG